MIFVFFLCSLWDDVGRWSPAVLAPGGIASARLYFPSPLLFCLPCQAAPSVQYSNRRWVSIKQTSRPASVEKARNLLLCSYAVRSSKQFIYSLCIMAPLVLQCPVLLFRMPSFSESTYKVPCSPGKGCEPFWSL